MECGELFLKIKEAYRDLLPTHGINSMKHKIKKFFDCVAVIMSRQIRQIVFKSLNHFMNKIRKYKVL